MNKQKKHLHSKQKKMLKKFSWTILGLVVVIVAGIWAWKSPVVQSRVQASFGDNAAYQKKEYNRQRALAKKKYGQSESSVKETKAKAPAKKTTAKAAKSSTKKVTKSGKYLTIVVKNGEFLSTIAEDYGTTVDELIELNDLESREISAGVQLKVPDTGKRPTEQSNTQQVDTQSAETYTDNDTETETQDNTSDETTGTNETTQTETTDASVE